MTQALFGWRVMFVIMGAAGLVMAAAWYLAYRNPTEVALTADEIVYRTEGDPPGERFAGRRLVAVFESDVVRQVAVQAADDRGIETDDVRKQNADGDAVCQPVMGR